jgi:hypothetical protein
LISAVHEATIHDEGLTPVFELAERIEAERAPQPLPEGEKCERWTIRTCEYPGCDLIEEADSVTHSHGHRTLKSPPYTETPLSEPFEVMRVSDCNGTGKKPLPEAPRCGGLAKLKQLVDRQAEDRDLWRTKATNEQAVRLQAALNRIHEAIELELELSEPEAGSVDGEEGARKLDWPARCKNGGEVRILRCPVCGRLTVDWPEAVRGVACFDGHPDAGDYEVVKRFRGTAAIAVWALFQARQLATDEEWQGEILSQGASLLDAIDQRVDVALADIAVASPDTQDSDRGLEHRFDCLYLYRCPHHGLIDGGHYSREHEWGPEDGCPLRVGGGEGTEPPPVHECGEEIERVDFAVAFPASGSTDAEGEKP